jgi:3-oxoacyl-[acyl-carrier protein] reductase
MSDETKVAIVTGSALNIGRSTALQLARDGFFVVVTARQAEHDAGETARLVRDAGSEALVHMADISDPAQARGLVGAAVARFGRLDALVNNASVRRQTKFADMTPEEWREIMSTTLDGAFAPMRRRLTLRRRAAARSSIWAGFRRMSAPSDGSTR